MAQHNPVSKQTDVDLQGEVVDGPFSCELVESHSGPVHAVVVYLLAFSCSSFPISAPSSLFCFYLFGLSPPFVASSQNLSYFWCILIGSWN
jgi:hypothetical protein